MASANTVQVIEFIHATLEQLAQFARESYRAEGRGVVRVAFPAAPPPGMTAVISTDMVYQTHEQVLDLFRDLSGELREDAHVLIRMMETYDPMRQAVVMAQVGQGNPITIKMKLDPPFVMDEPGGIH